MKGLYNMIYGYLRAIENCHPKREISSHNQLEILKDYEHIETIFQDEITIKGTGRENLYRLLEIIKQNDTIVITKLSRIADNFKDLTDLCSLLSSKGIHMNVLDLGDITQNISNISNEKWLNALYQFENDTKYERICKGHLKSKNNQQSNTSLRKGSPVKYSNKQLSEALKLRDRYTFQEISSLTGICKRTLLRANKKMQL